MSDANKAMVRRWFEEVWNQKRLQTVDEMFSSSGVAHGLDQSGADVYGPDGFKAFAERLLGGFPDSRVRIDDMFSEDDRVAVRMTYEGTHNGPALGIEPTGRKVSVRGIVIARIANGQIVEAWNCLEQPGIERQIGLV